MENAIKIFLSYRRTDAGYAGRLYDSLNSNLNNVEVFRDVNSIGYGQRFRTELEDQVSACRCMVAVIGPTWLRAPGDSGTEKQEEDFVRYEVATALARGVPVVPVLLPGAVLPAVDQLPDDLKGIRDHQALAMSDQRWNTDIESLIGALDDLGVLGREPPTHAAEVVLFLTRVALVLIVSFAGAVAAANIGPWLCSRIHVDWDLGNLVYVVMVATAGVVWFLALIRADSYWHGPVEFTTFRLIRLSCIASVEAALAVTLGVVACSGTNQVTFDAAVSWIRWIPTPFASDDGRAAWFAAGQWLPSVTTVWLATIDFVSGTITRE